MVTEVVIKKTGVLVVLRSSSGLLLMKRTKNPHLGKYIPIGGKLEPFETSRAAAVREIMEETKQPIGDVALRGVMTETSPTAFNWVNFIYVAEVEPFDPPACDEGFLEWVPIAGIPQLPTPTTDMFIYDYIARGVPFILNAEYDQDLNLMLLEDEMSGATLFPRM